MTQPRILHTHLWDGHTLPAWLPADCYRWDGGLLVVRHPDGDTPIRPGWSIVGWSDGTCTVGSPTTSERVYGPHGLHGQLERVRAAAKHFLHEYEGGEDPCAAAVLATLDEPAPATPAEPNPPGSTREQLPNHILGAIRNRLPDYLSTACQTADITACAVDQHPGMHDELRAHAERLHSRCRRNQKFTGQLCVCGCHPTEETL